MSSNKIESAGFSANQAGLFFQEMNTKQKNVALEVLMLTVNGISGVKLPPDKKSREILLPRLSKFLCEHPKYQDLTIEEIVFAFELNAASEKEEKVEHYQAILCLDYLGAVLNKWIPIKRKIKLKVERELVKRNLFELDEMTGLNDDQIIQYSKDEWARTGDPMFLESRAYDILSNRGELKLTTEQKHEILSRARLKIDTICRRHNELSGFDRNGQVESIVAKKIALAEHFNGAPILEKTAYTQQEQERINAYRGGL